MPRTNWPKWQAGLHQALTPAGRLYASLLACRQRAYSLGWLPSWRPPAPCISVGNISWGGTGKSPLCQYLLTWALDQGLDPALLTRGYRAQPPHLPYLVAADSPVGQSGDEPLMLKKACPGARVVVDPKRRRSGPWVWQEFKPDIFVLDDGLQHLALQRDIDLVLLRPEDLFDQWDRVLPAGSWREGRKALDRADAFCLQARPEDRPGLARRFQDLLGQLNRPLFFFAPFVRGLTRVINAQPLAKPDTPYLLVSAVAGPDRVLASAQGAFGPPAGHLDFPDHHRFGPRDWAEIDQVANKKSCSSIVCTAKDAVKLAAFADKRLLGLDLDLELTPDLLSGQPFLDWLKLALIRAEQGLGLGNGYGQRKTPGT